jgi:hypothetical protein
MKKTLFVSLAAVAAGTFPRKIREYRLNRKIISMPFAVRASTSEKALKCRRWFWRLAFAKHA